MSKLNISGKGSITYTVVKNPPKKDNKKQEVKK